MNTITITVSGPYKSGKSWIVQAIEVYLQNLGKAGSSAASINLAKRDKSKEEIENIISTIPFEFRIIEEVEEKVPVKGVY